MNRGRNSGAWAVFELLLVALTLGFMQGLVAAPAQGQILAPQRISLEPGNGSVRVAWQISQVPGGLKHVRVVASPSGKSCESPDGACIVTGLKNGTAYTFEATAINLNGREGETAVAGPAWPCCDEPQPPVSVAVESGNGSAVVSWEPPGNVGAAGQTFSYTVSSRPAGGSCGTAERSCLITGLTNGVGYVFLVSAVNLVGQGPPASSFEATPKGPPSAPTNVNAYLRKRGTATITWLSPQSTGGAAVTGFVASSIKGGITCESNGALSCEVSGLMNGETYVFTVTAYNDRGAGLVSLPSKSATPLAGPSSPRRISVSAGSGRAAVSWKPPASLGGLPVTKYVVRSSPGGSTCLTQKTSCTVSRLRPGTAYIFTVEAVNRRGSSIPAQSRVVRTPGVAVVQIPTSPSSPGTNPSPSGKPEIPDVPSSPKPAPDFT